MPAWCSYLFATSLLVAGTSVSASEYEIIESTPYTAETELLLKRADRLAERFERAKSEHSGIEVVNTESVPALLWREDEVIAGDTLSEIFNRHGLGYAEWSAILALGGDTRQLKNLKEGAHVRLAFNSDDEFTAFELTIDELKTLRVDRIFKDYHAKVIEQPYDSVLVTVNGIVENSLFVAAKDAGLADRLTMNLTNIFAWDIDFAKDIREGDSFTVVYEKIYKNGRFMKDGEIMAAEFVNLGRTVRALRFTDERGQVAYFSPEGASLKKAFLRTPGQFTRVSSGFTKSRKHPIKNVWRAHKGVDYAAPTGTDIIAAGSGRIKFIGTQRGYGKVVIVDHSQGYTTLYAHMSKFARGLRKGDSVDQGTVIGAVGQSGAATGPHLHYEFRVNRVHQNPLTVDLPMAAPVARHKMSDFQQASARLLDELNAARSSSVAYNEY